MLWNAVKCSHYKRHKNRGHLREDMCCIHSFHRIAVVNQYLLETCCQALFTIFFYWSIVDLQCCVSGVQQCESVIHISAFSQILFPYSVKHSFKHILITNTNSFHSHLPKNNPVKKEQFYPHLIAEQTVTPRK